MAKQTYLAWQVGETLRFRPPQSRFTQEALVSPQRLQALEALFRAWAAEDQQFWQEAMREPPRT